MSTHPNKKGHDQYARAGELRPLPDNLLYCIQEIALSCNFSSCTDGEHASFRRNGPQLGSCSVRTQSSNEIKPDVPLDTHAADHGLSKRLVDARIRAQTFAHVCGECGPAPRYLVTRTLLGGLVDQVEGERDLMYQVCSRAYSISIIADPRPAETLTGLSP